MAGIGLHAAGLGTPPDPIWQTGGLVPARVRLVQATTAATAEWQAHGSDQGDSRFSPLDQINAAKVKNLEVA